MSAIQSSVGLITGIPIQDTVDQLMQIAARPRDTLITRTNEVQAERGAVDTLASLVLSLQFSANSLDNDSIFGSRAAASSNSSVSVGVPNGSSPAIGSYQFTPLQAASAHQFVSTSFSDLDEAVGDGTLRFGFGGQVTRVVRSVNSMRGRASRPAASRSPTAAARPRSSTCARPRPSTTS